MPSKPLESIVDGIFGYDFFISYSHGDGKLYPRLLKSRLEEAGFKVFLDQADYTAGMDLRRETSRQVRKSRKIVIVGRPGALASEWVRREVEIGVAHQKTPVIININGAIQTARDSSGLAAMAIENHWLRLEETLPHVEGPPSDQAVAELIRSFRATRQETKRQRIIATAAAIFAVAAAFALWQALEADWQRQVAVDNQREAERQRIVATRNEAVARENEQRATSERNKTLVTQSRFLADVARRKIAEGDRQTAMLLALEALPDRNATEEIRRERPYVPEPAVALDAGWRAPGQTIHTLKHAGNIVEGRYSADGSRLLITRGDVQLWDVVTGRLLLDAKELGRDLDRAEFALRDEVLILSGSERLIAWDTKSRQVIYSIDEVTDFVLAPNGLAVTRSPFPHNVMSVRDIRTGRQLCVLAQGLDPLPVLTAGGDRIITWQEKAIQFWDARTCRAQGRPISTPDRITDTIEVTTDGTRLAAALGNSTITLWDVPNRRMLWTVEGGAHGEVGQKMLSPDNRKLVAYTSKSLADKAVTIIDINSGRKLLSFPRTTYEDADQVVFSPNGEDMLYVPDGSPSVPELWTLAKRKQGNFVSLLEGHKNFVRTAEFSPDGKSIATASDDGTVRLWEAATGKMRAVLNHDGGALTFATFAPGSSQIATASADRNQFDPKLILRTWDITEGQRRSIPDGASITVDPDPADAESGSILSRLTSDRRKALAVSGDHKRAVILSEDDGLLLWDVPRDMLVAALEGHRGKIESALFSADGLRLVSVSGEQATLTADGGRYPLDQWDNEARVWDAESGRPLAVLSASGKSRWTAQFAAGGILTTSASEGKHLWKYFPNLQDFIEQVKATAPRCLDAGERKAYFLDSEPPGWCATGARRDNVRAAP